MGKQNKESKVFVLEGLVSIFIQILFKTSHVTSSLCFQVYKPRAPHMNMKTKAQAPEGHWLNCVTPTGTDNIIPMKYKSYGRDLLLIKWYPFLPLTLNQPDWSVGVARKEYRSSQIPDQIVPKLHRQPNIKYTYNIKWVSNTII